jgi:hypothetical protein
MQHKWRRAPDLPLEVTGQTFSTFSTTPESHRPNNHYDECSMWVIYVASAFLMSALGVVSLAWLHADQALLFTPLTMTLSPLPAQKNYGEEMILWMMVG